MAHTFFPPCSLARAVQTLGFVQADPIRAPARAQDLILRQRVKAYRAGALERAFASLDLEEDYLYAYGFMPADKSALLHPRTLTQKLHAIDHRVLEAVRELGVVHPRALEDRFGKKRARNAWGGFSRASKRSLERLHHRGLIRVAARERGVRLYAVTPSSDLQHTPDQRLRGLTLLVANVLAPISLPLLRSLSTRLRRWMPRATPAPALIKALLAEGALRSDVVDQVSYLSPAHIEAPEPARVVRLLAPFDPLVWDRARFEHMFGWAYRFEAYTPVTKRIRGYYALPLSWRDRVVGWANASTTSGTLEVDVGFHDGRPRERDFTRELDAEITRLATFLKGDPEA